MNENLLYNIAITLINGVGATTAKKLIAYSGSSKEVFKSKKSTLIKIPDIGEVTAQNIVNQNILERAEQELKFIEKYKIVPLFYSDDEFPFRLKNCADSPVMLYTKGDANLNHQKMISIVGTRMASDYGKSFCENFIKEISEKYPEVVIVSGLAYGIDISAHKFSLANKVKTFAVLAHGLDRIYPQNHKTHAKHIVEENGSLITEFLSETIPDRQNFVQRNRIVAGMTDATIVIESGKKGGSLITADIANSYNRDVFAVPGRHGDEMSKGCNFLIKTNRANLLESVADIEYIMGWESSKTNSNVQTQMNFDLSTEEKLVYTILQQNKELNIDTICQKCELPMSETSAVLLNLEFSGLVKCLPGKIYKLR